MRCARARVINHFSSSLLLSLITRHVSFCLRPYSIAFTIDDDELPPSFGGVPGCFRGAEILANIIQSSVDKIEEVLSSNVLVLPSSNVPFTLESESPRVHSSIQSAAMQLMTLVRPAPLVVTDVAMQRCYQVPRIYCNAYCSGYPHCRDPSRCRSQGLACTGDRQADRSSCCETCSSPSSPCNESHIHLFTNNRLSTVLDTGKPVEELILNPESKHIETFRLSSYIELVLDEAFKSSSYLTETLLDSEFGHATESALGPRHS
ncbi:hypothetical protein EDB89DRAFT_1925708 [Lactarius sanguifluus]|nr:hypothetical protein EDB89DRAFT_1925708 [Lactarius sanguifluus]